MKSERLFSRVILKFFNALGRKLTRNMFMHARQLVIAFIALNISPAMAVDIGQPAPAFEWRNESGSPVGLDQYKGKVVYLDFWASWCGPCRQSFPWMNEMLAKYAAKGLVVVGVNLDANAADAKKFLNETPAKFDVFFDNKGQSPKLYGVRGMPTSYLIDRNGKIASIHAGFNPAKKAELESALRNALGLE